MRSFASLSALLAVVLALQYVSNEVQSASLESAKKIAKSLTEKAADAADKTEAAEETGGVRQTVMHTGANLVLEKGLDALGKRYPVVAAAAPVVQKLSKPAMKKVHEKINQWRSGDPTTTEAPAEAKEGTTEATEEDKVTTEAPKEEKATTTEAPKEEKAEEEKDEKKADEGDKKETSGDEKESAEEEEEEEKKPEDEKEVKEKKEGEEEKGKKEEKEKKKKDE